MKKRFACVLAFLLSTSALANVMPNRYDCESGTTRLSFGPAEATGSPTLNLSLKGKTGAVSVYRSGRDLERVTTDSGVNINFTYGSTKKYRLILPVIRFKEFFQSTRTTAVLVETTTEHGHSTNAYFHLKCKASHVVY